MHNSINKDIKWKDSNKYVKRFKIFRKGYIYFRAFEYRVWATIKKIIFKYYLYRQ